METFYSIAFSIFYRGMLIVWARRAIKLGMFKLKVSLPVIGQLLPSLPSFLLVENYNLNNPIITGDLLCGGLTQASKDTCLKFENGGWTEFSWKLLAKRRFHVSWKRADGKVLAEYSMEFLGIEC